MPNKIFPARWGDPTLRLKAFFFFNFMAISVLIPYLSLYLFKKGLGGAQVAVLLGIMPLVRIVAQPLWAWLSDRYRIHRQVLSLSLVGVALVSLLLTQTAEFPSLVGLFFVFAIFDAVYGPFGPAIAINYLESIQRPNEFGSLRLWGSLGYILASLAIGNLFLNTMLNFLPVLYALVMALAAGAAWLLPDVSIPRAPASRAGRGGIFAQNPAFLVFLAGMVCIGFTFGIVNQYFVVYMNSIQASGMAISLAMAIMALPEIPLMAWAARLVERYGIKICLLGGFILVPLRYFLYAQIVNPWLVLPVQLIHGVTVVSMLVVGATYVARQLPAQFRATGQGLYSAATNGIGMSLGMFSAGFLYEPAGINAIWIVCALVGLAGSGIIFGSFALERK